MGQTTGPSPVHTLLWGKPRPAEIRSCQIPSIGCDRKASIVSSAHVRRSMRKVVKTQVKEEVVRGFISTILPYVQSQLAWEKARMLGDIRERQEYGPDFYWAKEQQHKVLLKIIEDCV